MTRKITMRVLAVTVAVAAALVLGSCKLPGSTPNFTIFNPNPSGTGDYTNIFVDHKSIPVSPITGQGQYSMTLSTSGSHTIYLTFNSGQVPTFTFTVPSQGCTLNGPTLSPPTNTFTGCP